jgi:hypothetical protein
MSIGIGGWDRYRKLTGERFDTDTEPDADKTGMVRLRCRELESKHANFI